MKELDVICLRIMQCHYLSFDSIFCAVSSRESLSLLQSRWKKEKVKYKPQEREIALGNDA